MRIGIDVQTLETYERSRGIGRLCARAIQTLSELVPEHEVLLFGFAEKPHAGVSGLLGPRVHYVRIRLEGRREEHLRMGCAAPFLRTTPEAASLDVYHVTSPMMHDILLPMHGPCPVVATLLDAIPALMEERGTPELDGDAARRYWDRTRVLRRYDRYVAISESAAADCSRLLLLDARKIDVTWVPVPQRVPGKSANWAPIADRFGTGDHYIISISGWNPRKNIVGTLKAFACVDASLRSRFPLVLVCSLQPEERKHVMHEAEKLGVMGDLRLTGYVSDEELDALLTHATVMLFPTYYEGFGLPAADAMVHGVPVVASNTSSLPEVLGDSGSCHDPDDHESLANALTQFLRDPEHCARHRASGFRQVRRFAPHEYAERLLHAYRSAAGGRVKSLAPQVSSPRLRVASFSPLSPANTGIADYTEHLLTHMPADLQIDCYVDGYVPTNASIAGRFNCLDHAEFVHRHAWVPYDAILYQLGNNTLHASTIPIAERFPGVVVLHEASLLNVHRVLAREYGMRHAVQNDFAGQYPGEDASIWEHQTLVDSMDVLKHPMLRRLVARSKAIIVHSEWMRTHIETVDGTCAPVTVIPHGVAFHLADAARPLREELRRKYQVPQNAFVVISIGRINRPKRFHVLLEAFARFHAVVPSARLLSVGQSDPLLLRELNRTSVALSLKHAVRFLGHRDMEELLEVIALGDVGVNLRFPTMGETSGPLMLMFAFGKPVLVSAVNQFLEYPDDVCWKVVPGKNEVSQIVEYLHHLHAFPEHGEILGRNARNHVEGNDWNATAHRYVEVLRTAATFHGTRS